MIEKGRLTLRERSQSVIYLGLAFALFILPEIVQTGRVSEAALAALLGTLLVGAVLLAAPSLLEKLSDERRRRIVVASSVIFNLIILGFFKYFNFFTDSFSDL
ncbi:MAG: hypothetical protein FJ194_05030 [Gammaproteobacteria bacterium]|nr:hypothetical protein [Gammaproteobacteria bacterium]